MRFAPLLLCATIACSVQTDKQADTVSTVDTLAEHAQADTVIGARTNSTAASAAASKPANTDSAKTAAPTASGTPNMTVTEYGIGPIRAGMTVEQAAQAMGGGFAAPKGGAEGCTYAVLTKAPRGLAVMLQDGVVARIEVRSGTIATAAGARIGDSEDRIKSLYPGRITTTPHKYVAGGHYLTVTPSDPKYRIVFETDGKKVKSFRSGRVPEVEQVERCG